jgi:drug/metabolite transporter (DMT)-like permease
MDSSAALLLLTVFVLDSASHVALKAASVRASQRTESMFVRALLRQPAMWLGGAMFAGVFLAWVAFLERVPLGQGVMSGSITIVGVMLGGRLFFREQITPARATALSLICAGVLLVGWGSP